MAEFKGLKKEDHEKLTRAAKMYATLTGETLDVGSIPVEQPEEDAKAKAERSQKELEAQAEATRAMEDAQRKERQIRTRPQGGEIQDENPGPGRTALVTEKARSEGASRRGDEPPDVKSAAGKR